MKPIPNLFEIEYSEKIIKNHPATDGHFDGYPIIPGAIILEYIRVALESFDKDWQITQFTKAKFLHPLKPGRELIVRIECNEEHQFRYQCFDDKKNKIAAGKFHAEKEAK